MEVAIIQLTHLPQCDTWNKLKHKLKHKLQVWSQSFRRSACWAHFVACGMAASHRNKNLCSFVMRKRNKCVKEFSKGNVFATTNAAEDDRASGKRATANNANVMWNIHICYDYFCCWCLSLLYHYIFLLVSCAHA